MAELIKELDKLPIKEQELILRQLSESYSPVEINSVIYMVPEEVDLLISSLSKQVEDLKNKISKD